MHNKQTLQKAKSCNLHISKFELISPKNWQNYAWILPAWEDQQPCCLQSNQPHGCAGTLSSLLAPGHHNKDGDDDDENRDDDDSKDNNNDANDNDGDEDSKDLDDNMIHLLFQPISHCYLLLCHWHLKVSSFTFW